MLYLSENDGIIDRLLVELVESAYNNEKSVFRNDDWWIRFDSINDYIEMNGSTTDDD